MWLQRCFNLKPIAAGLFAAILLSACGGTAPARPDPADTRRAETQSDSAVASADGSDPQIPAVVRTLFEQATAAMAAGDFVDAELRFKEFLLQYPDYPGAYVNLAIIHANSNDDASTRAAIEAALALDARHPAALNQLGMLLRRNGKFIEAEAAYLKAVTVSPDYALAHYNLGVLNELYLQRLAVALQHFETYQALVGEDKQVARWIKDLKRRVEKDQRSAKVAQ
jgi:Flp pilus assembly protein TadD